MVRNGDRGEGGDGQVVVAGTNSLPRLRDFSRSLPMSLLKAREAVMRHFRKELNRIGITEQQWRVLRALTAVRSIEVTALAEATCLLPPSLSRILKDLDDRGLVLRRTSKEDMRRGLISISRKGELLIETAGVQSEAIYTEIARRFGADKLAALQSMLRELETALAPPIDLRSASSSDHRDVSGGEA